jgi:hypothetical protein
VPCQRKVMNGFDYLRARFLALDLDLDFDLELEALWRVRKTLAVGFDLRALVFGAGFLRADFFLGVGLCISVAKAC